MDQMIASSANSTAMGSTPRADFQRQTGIVTPAQLAVPITLIGAGGLGSPTAMSLTKMGCTLLTVYDPDFVEPHNLPNQWFRLDDIGRPKVVALAEIVRAFSGVEIEARQELFTDQEVSRVVIACVDSMRARTAIWERVKFDPDVHFFIDARMGGQVGHVYGLNPCTPSKVKLYEHTLYTDADAAQEVCSERAVIFNTNVVASMIARVLTFHVREEELPYPGIARFLNMKNLTFF